MRFDDSIFFPRYRGAFGRLAQTQVDGLNAMLDSAERDPAFNSVRQLAYVFATVQRETNVSGVVNGVRVALTFNPVIERGPRSFFQRYEGRSDLGNNRPGDGFRFRGRGYVQITGRRNYTVFSDLLDMDLVSNPDIALEHDIAWSILSTGMHEGIFVPGQTLDRYIPEDDRSQADYFNARRIINPGEIRARPDVVRTIASNTLRWEAILRAARVA